MKTGEPHIIVKIDVKRPIEVDDFASAYTSLGSQYRKFIQANYPELGDDADIYVTEVSKGSIVIDFIPFAVAAWAVLPDQLHRIDVVVEFVKKYGSKLSAYFKPGGREDDATKSDISDWSRQVAAIANDPNGKAALEVAVFEDKKKKVRAAFKFATPEAKQAVVNLEQHRRDIERQTGADHRNVVMVFHQANIKTIDLGKRTGERVVIEDISDRDLPLIYASDLAEQRIKDEIREAQDNLFRKGFVVDVNVANVNRRPVAYRVTAVHQVIDLPDEEDNRATVIA